MGRPRKAPLTEMQKLAKKIGPDGQDRLAEMEAMTVEELNKRIAQATQSISDTKAELEADLPNGDSSPYTKAKNQLKFLSEGLKEVKKRQNAIITVAVKLRKEKGAA